MSHSIRVKRDPGGCVIEVAGDVDSAATEAFNAALDAVAADLEQPAVVIVDLSKANFLDSRSMGILADSQAEIRAAGGRLAIAGTRPEVVGLFRLIGLEEAFEFFASPEDARKDAR